MTTISAKTILRSRNVAKPDKVLSTLLLRYPRCIHAEFMTHRQFSRNAASSRAIPVQKMIADVILDPFIPLVWGKNQKGMQSSEDCNEKVSLGVGKEGTEAFYGLRYSREDAWRHALNSAVRTAKAFDKAGYHKQLVNRLLEPFSHITVLVSSTEWSNFLALRDHPDAEPHIQMLAKEVRQCLDNDPIENLYPGEWHLPFAPEDLGAGAELPMDMLIRYSAACCASTSYKTVEGFDMTLERANAIFEKLIEKPPLHASPFEHVAKADTYDEGTGDPYKALLPWGNKNQHGNFEGFIQYRKTLKNEVM